MIGTLVAHSGSTPVTRQELEAIEPPKGTASWKPVKHSELITVLEQEIQKRNLDIREQSYAVQREGAVLYGVIDLWWRKTEEFAAAIGVRTANDKSLSLQIAVGMRVFVCDNLAFAGDLIALRRKHTAGLNLPQEIAAAMDRYQEGVLNLEDGIDRLRETRISDEEAKSMIVDVFRQDILPVRFFRDVTDPYFVPLEMDPEAHPRSLWVLHNVMTRQIKRLSPGPKAITK